MSARRIRAAAWWLLMAAKLQLVLSALPADGATVYRFGLRRAGSPPIGVDLRQIPWSFSGDAGSDSNLVFRGFIRPALFDPRRPLKLSVSGQEMSRAFDDDLGTFFRDTPYDCDEQFGSGASSGGLCTGQFGPQGTISIDLPDALTVERIQIQSGTVFGEGVVENVAIHLSPEPLDGDVSVRTPFAREVGGNRERTLNIVDLPTETKARAVQILVAEHEQPYRINEISIFGTGANGFASYTSNMIDAGRPKIWGDARWMMTQPDGARVLMSMRAGDEPKPLRYWRYTGSGGLTEEVTADEYAGLISTLRAGTTINTEVFTTWSPTATLQDGVDLPLPARPRRVLQFRLDFLSSGEEGAQIDWLEIRASEPKALEVVGELAPIEVEAGSPTAFTYTIKPRLQPTDTGFDRVEIRAAAAAIDGVDSLRVDGSRVEHRIRSLQRDRIVVDLPRVGQEHTDALVEVFFRARVLRFGAAFATFLHDTEQPIEVAQPVPAGNAFDDVIGDRVWIETSVRVRSVLRVETTPPTISPNGDGINDVTAIDFDVVETTAEVVTRVQVFDLRGQPVRDLGQRTVELGRHGVQWDGRNDGGRLVAPGLYVVRVSVDVGDGAFDRVGTVAVVY